jgi:hypothetical protein
MHPDVRRNLARLRDSHEGASLSNERGTIPRHQVAVINDR